MNGPLLSLCHLKCNLNLNKSLTSIQVNKIEEIDENSSKRFSAAIREYNLIFCIEISKLV